MRPTTSPMADELSNAGGLPQLDASSLVDGERLEAEVTAMYRQVARGEVAELHFELDQGQEHAACIEELLQAIRRESPD